jgi:glycosyltransferase involved in cell wall biosynthesis
VIACVSPKAAEHYRKLCHVYGGGSLAGRVTVLPHAVEPHFRFSGTPKRRQVACVGRWQDVVQKRPWLLVEVIDALVAGDDNVSVVIVGEPTGELQSWCQSLDESRGRRVTLAGRVDREKLAAILAESQVFYSSSAFESFGIAAAEALCSGCSVVAGRSVSMASFEWFVSEESGTLAVEDHAGGHLNALKNELRAWEDGLRDARKISEVWGYRVHADNVAKRVVEMMLMQVDGIGTSP